MSNRPVPMCLARPTGYVILRSLVVLTCAASVLVLNSSQAKSSPRKLQPLEPARRDVTDKVAAMPCITLAGPWNDASTIAAHNQSDSLAQHLQARDELEQEPQLTGSVKYYLQYLAAVEADLPEGDAKVTALLKLLANQAAERSNQTSVVVENRAILVTMAIAQGHSQFAMLAGVGPQAQTIRQIQRRTGAMKLRGRRDWAQHFAVSAGITALASPRLGNAAGLWKESRDSRGGSGFSFSDLLADRAGVWFATLATRDEETAQQVQQQMRHGISLETFFPEAADLPEGIQASTLETVYGGIGGAGYQELSAEINRRLWACELFKAFAPKVED